GGTAARRLPRPRASLLLPGAGGYLRAAPGRDRRGERDGRLRVGEGGYGRGAALPRGDGAAGARRVPGSGGGHGTGGGRDRGGGGWGLAVGGPPPGRGPAPGCSRGPRRRRTHAGRAAGLGHGGRGRRREVRRGVWRGGAGGVV